MKKHKKDKNDEQHRPHHKLNPVARYE
jgi:hypothetical protein